MNREFMNWWNKRFENHLGYGSYFWFDGHMKFVLVDIMLRTTVLLPCVPYSFITLARVKHYQAMTNTKHVSVYSYTEFFWTAKMDKIVEGFFLFSKIEFVWLSLTHLLSETSDLAYSYIWFIIDFQ